MRIGAAAYVGRVGGLAVALGIGAAVVSAAGAAAADPSAGSGSDSSSAAADEPSAGLSPVSGLSDDLQTVEADNSEQSSEQSTKISSVVADDLTASTARRSSSVSHREHADSTDPRVESSDDASPAPDANPTATTAVVASATETPEVATQAISTVVSTLPSPSTGDEPASPMESAAMWTIAAAARRESFAAPPAANATPAVVAIEQTPPLEWLQHVPIIGPLIVTPIVAFIHQIPVVSDVLHPLIGYPVRLGLPAGTPVPRDVKVTSFDGTRIYTHFMPALGLGPGQTAPTILNGPGLGLPGATNLVRSPLADAINGVLTDFVGQVGLVNDITAPTLLIQGTVDTIFSLQEADDTAQTLIANGVPTKVLWFCGGHGVCLNNLFDFSDGAVIQTRTLEWLDRYVKDDLSVSTGPQFEWVDQRGQWFSSDVYPVSQDAPLVTASSAGAVLPLIPYLGGSGLPVVPLAFKALNAVNLTVPEASTPTYLVGAPELTLTYSGTGTGRHVYAQLVDDTTGLVLGSIVTPIPVTLDGQPHTITIDLEPVAHTLAPGETVTLQLVSAAGIYETVVPSLGTLKVSSMQIALPTVDAAATSASSVVQPMSA